MNKKTLISLVKKEAKKLKKFATKGELESLNFQELKPDTTWACIYGQMTGNCWSYRSKELITKCSEKVYLGLSDGLLKGKPNFTIQNRNAYFSPIEVFIYNDENRKNGNNKIIIDYLKGKTKTLIFNN